MNGPFGRKAVCKIYFFLVYSENSEYRTLSVSDMLSTLFRGLFYQYRILVDGSQQNVCYLEVSILGEVSLYL